MTRRGGNTIGLGAGMFIGAWVLLLGILTVHFSGWLDERDNPNQAVAGKTSELGVREVRLFQNRVGHYVAKGRINGSSVRFVLDTGATAVAVPGRVAEQLGLRAGRPQLAKTANGTITTYRTRLDEVSLGTIRLRNVRADINPHMEGNDVLLGMSFLRSLELVQRDGTLTLRQYDSL